MVSLHGIIARYFFRSSNLKKKKSCR